MVDEKMKELQAHGRDLFPIACYEWSSDKEPDGMLECHWHDEWELFTILEGSAYFSVDGAKTLISAGDVVFISGDRLHMAEAVNNEPFKYRAVVFSPGILCRQGDIIHTKYILPMPDRKLKSFFMSWEPSNGAVTIFNKLFETLTDCPPAYELTAKALLFEMLTLIFTGNEHGGGYEYASSVDNIKRVIDYIHKNYASPLTVRDLAQIARMSDGHFSRQFKILTSKPPIDYVKWVRLTNASKLIAETNEKLIYIAIDTGFNNISYFTRSFSDYFGLSPVKFRKLRGRQKQGGIS